MHVLPRLRVNGYDTVNCKRRIVTEGWWLNFSFQKIIRWSWDENGSVRIGPGLIWKSPGSHDISFSSHSISLKDWCLWAELLYVEGRYDYLSLSLLTGVRGKTKKAIVLNTKYMLGPKLIQYVQNEWCDLLYSVFQIYTVYLIIWNSFQPHMNIWFPNPGWSVSAFAVVLKHQQNLSYRKGTFLSDCVERKAERSHWYAYIETVIYFVTMWYEMIFLSSLDTF